MSSLSRLLYFSRVALFGHLLNPLWLSRKRRRSVFCNVARESSSDYFDRYLPYFNNLEPDAVDGDACASSDTIFSIWLQGEESAPPIVRSCFGSIRANCGKKLVVLDANNICDWIQLPGYVIDKWKLGKIKPAHFTDICRIELLYQYGGLWMDATDFAAAPIPDWIWNEDFFVYMSGENVRGYYSFIQNCFIRAKKGNYLMKLWRTAVLAYWEHEDKAIDYYIHQLLFKKVVESNNLASEKFEKMPKCDQDSTHLIWYAYGNKPFDADTFKTVCAKSAFQKTEYKSSSANNPLPGSFIDHIIKMYI